jgi:hypothetical protein
MYPTVSGSARQGVQTLIGLGVGIALAFPIILLGNPTPVTVALVVGLGVLLAGIRRLGAGRDWLPMAALFVLVLGGNNPDGYSLAYATQMLVGIGVGLSVNMLVFPPLHLNGAVHGLDELRASLARQLAEMGTAIEEAWPPEHEDWASRQNKLTGFSAEVRNAVQLAASSQHGNIRRRRHGRDLRADYHTLHLMERVTFYVEDMTEILADIIWHAPQATTLPQDLGPPLAKALARTADAVDEWDAQCPAMDRAEAAVEDLMRQANRSAAADERIDATAALGMGLRRILLTIRTDARPDETRVPDAATGT